MNNIMSVLIMVVVFLSSGCTVEGAMNTQVSIESVKASTFEVGETKELSEFLPNGSILNQYGMNITKVTLVDVSKYESTLYNGEAGSVFIKINSNAGSLAYIKANKINATEGGYTLGTATYYPTDRVDITKVEYLAFYNYGSEVMEVIVNPFKK